MNTIQLECFVAVAENLSFARASEILHITQPAVTHQINSLEKELEVKLFKRTTRTVELTNAGWNFIEDAKNILNITHMAKMRISNNLKETRIPFIVGCYNKLELNLIPNILRPFLEEVPEIHPILKTALPQTLRTMLENETIDVMLGFKNGDFATYTELTKADIVCICPKTHPFAKKNIVALEELKYGKIVICDPRRNYPLISSHHNQIVGSRSPSEVYICENAEATFSLMKSVDAFTILPDIPMSRDSTMCYIPIENSEKLSFGIYSKNQDKDTNLKRFIKVAKGVFEV